MSTAEQRVIQVLSGLGIPYEIVEIDPVFANTTDFSEKYAYPLENSGNTIVVASRKPLGRYGACIVRGSDRLDVNKRVKGLLGVRRLSFASPEVTMELTGMEIGGVTPFDLPGNIPIFADQKLMLLEYVILGAGVRSSKIKVSPEIFRKIPGAEIIEGLSLESA